MIRDAECVELNMLSARQPELVDMVVNVGLGPTYLEKDQFVVLHRVLYILYRIPWSPANLLS